MPSTSTSGPPIMKSVWIVDVLKPSSSSSARSRVAALDRLEDARPRRRCGTRVLVEERVQEIRPVRPTRESPSTSATSPSNAAPSSVRICSRIDLDARARVTSTARPPSKRISRSRTTLPGERQRLRRAHRSLGAAPVGSREDLLRRHVDDVPAAVHCLLERSAPVRARRQPDGEVGAGPAEADAVEPRSFSSVPRSTSFSMCPATPRRGRARRAASPRRPRPRAARRPARRRPTPPSPRSGRRRSSS